MEEPLKPNLGHIKRAKHGISDILGSSETVVKQEQPVKPAGPVGLPFDRLQQTFQAQMNFNLHIRVQQAQEQANQQANHAVHQQMPVQPPVNPYANPYAHTNAAQQTHAAHAAAQLATQGPPQGHPGPVNRYWSDAMYSLLLRAQQTQQMAEKLPGADGRVPSQHSDSGHESGNADSGSEHDPNTDTAVAMVPPVSEQPAPTHQIKPQW